MILAIYSWFVIPVQCAFNPSFSFHPAYIVVDSIINFIFIVDVFINFRTTFLHPLTGEEVFDSKRIALHYLKSRFIIDLIAIIPLDNIVSLFIITDNVSAFSLVSLLKLTRIMRLGRLISIMKVNDEVKLSLRLIKIIFFLVLFVHWQGWAWYRI